MENNKNISLKNRRIIVDIFVSSLLFIFLPFFYITGTEYDWVKYTTSIAATIFTFLIASYMKRRTDAFLITAYGEDKLDERQYIIRLRAQRDAYNFTINITMLLLPAGTFFFKNDLNLFSILVFTIIMMLKIYLPTMIVAWCEKEV